MPATALDLLPLDRARFELRFPDGDTSQDTSLEALIRAAVQIVMTDVSLPLVNVSVFRSEKASKKKALVFVQPLLVSIESVQYQAETDTPTPGSFPDTVDPALYSVDSNTPGTKVISPVGEWPTSAYSAFLVNGTFGLSDNDPRLESLRAATTLAFRSLYDGVTMVREMDAYTRIISPLINYSPWFWTPKTLAG